MKRSLAVAFAITLCLAGGRLMWENNLSGADATVSAQAKITGGNIVKKSFEVSPAGALVKVKSAQGLEIFSARPSNEGFALAYELYDPKNKKTKLDLPDLKNDVQVLTVVGKDLNKKLVYCAECQEIRKLQNLPQLDENRAVTSARTTDGVLMVSSSFKYDGKKLKVYRVIQNVSADPYLPGEIPAQLQEIKKQPQPVTVRLLSIQTQNDAVLTGTTPKVSFGEFHKFKDSAQRSQRNSDNFRFGFLPAPSLFFSRACGDCPTECEFTLNLGSLQRGTICIDCPGRMTEDRINIHAGGIRPKGTFVRVTETIDRDCDSPITVNYLTAHGAEGGRDSVLIADREKMAVSPQCGAEGLIGVRSCPIKSPLTDASFCKNEWKPLVILSRGEREGKTISSTTESFCRGLRADASGVKNPFVTSLIAPGNSRTFTSGVKQNKPPLRNSDLEPGQGIVLVIEYDLTQTKP